MYFIFQLEIALKILKKFENIENKMSVISINIVLQEIYLIYCIFLQKLSEFSLCLAIET